MPWPGLEPGSTCPAGDVVNHYTVQWDSSEDARACRLYALAGRRACRLRMTFIGIQQRAPRASRLLAASMALARWQY